MIAFPGECSREGFPVEYKGIRYTIRARIERNEWTVSIHPADVESSRRVVIGPRERAELLARIMQRFDLCAVQGAVFG